MPDSTKKVCPECKGRKMIPGVCVCNSEWRGNQVGDDWDDCQCAREQECPTCKGTGHIEGK